MFKGEFKFDLNDALVDGYRARPQYGDAYHVTNEESERWSPSIDIPNPRILTVAASGDQPVMYAANGASTIDTFDLTINACLVMDFKTSALQLDLDQDTYRRQVDYLALLCETQMRPKDKKTFDKIIDMMPDRTRELMRLMILKRPFVFTRTQNIQQQPVPDNVYQKMKQSVQRPFNFIWTDLGNLHKYIDGTYDLIYISNIFDHYLMYGDRGPHDMAQTIQNLWPHLNDGGQIIASTCRTDVFKIFHRNNKTLAQLPTNAFVLPVASPRTFNGFI
ncbi:hypothetical protein HDR66_01645, partial [bacterium]|nr:hypothetical protein [bacterium]